MGKSMTPIQLLFRRNQSHIAETMDMPRTHNHKRKYTIFQLNNE